MALCHIGELAGTSFSEKSGETLFHMYTSPINGNLRDHAKFTWNKSQFQSQDGLTVLTTESTECPNATDFTSMLQVHLEAVYARICHASEAH